MFKLTHLICYTSICNEDVKSNQTRENPNSGYKYILGAYSFYNLHAL